jgi:hypothetical protein
MINPFRKPSPVMLASAELEDAQRSLLASQSAAEYAKRMSEYHMDRIKRLTAFLKAAHTEGEQA